MACVALG